MKLRIASLDKSMSNQLFASSLVGNLHATSKRMHGCTSISVLQIRNCTPECMAVKLQDGDHEAVPAW